MPKIGEIKVEERCPKCGSHLILREGQYGEFLACPRFPRCRFTKPCPAADNEWHEDYRPPPAHNDREYPFAYKPEDYDFPMSFSFYRGLCQEHGWAAPGPDRPAKSEEPPEVFYRYRPLDDEVDQLKSELRGWRKKHAEMQLLLDKLAKPKPF